MYTPTYFKVEQPEKLKKLIQENPFAVLISGIAGKPVISHLPFHWSETEGKVILSSHMARANPHWELFERSPEVTVVFQGPHAYISPAWYPPSPANVPTWNYTAVHAHGRARLLKDREQAWQLMDEMVRNNESKYGKGWVPDKTGAMAKIDHITVFQIDVQRFEGKFKLSQQQNPTVRNSVARELMGSVREADRSTGQLMLEPDSL